MGTFLAFFLANVLCTFGFFFFSDGDFLTKLLCTPSPQMKIVVSFHHMKVQRMFDPFTFSLLQKVPWIPAVNHVIKHSGIIHRQRF